MRILRILILIAFFVNCLGPMPVSADVGAGLAPAQKGQSQGLPLQLPKPGVMVHLSSEFTPAHLSGLVIHPEDPLKFDFLIHRGDGSVDKNAEYTKLIKYFLASLTVPDEDQWVNLSPYEKDRIINENFGKTEMGRDLLAQDYLLKQITASMIYPQDKLGEKFWNKIYQRAWEEYHTTNIPVNTFNKVWIIPDEAAVYESGNTVYVLKNHLKVMLEEDYLSLNKHKKVSDTFLTSQIIREIILPELEREVNGGENFAPLRQIYSAMILATWYKRSLKESLLTKAYADKSKIQGVNLEDPKANQEIYQQYLKAFKKGVFNYIKEDIDKYSKQVIPRKYFSGGMTKGYADGSMIKRYDSHHAMPATYYQDAALLSRLDLAQVALNTSSPVGLKKDQAMKAAKEEENFLDKTEAFSWVIFNRFTTAGFLLIAMSLGGFFGSPALVLSAAGPFLGLGISSVVLIYKKDSQGKKDPWGVYKKGKRLRRLSVFTGMVGLSIGGYLAYKPVLDHGQQFNQFIKVYNDLATDERNGQPHTGVALDQFKVLIKNAYQVKMEHFYDNWWAETILRMASEHPSKKVRDIFVEHMAQTNLTLSGRHDLQKAFRENVGVKEVERWLIDHKDYPIERWEIFSAVAYLYTDMMEEHPKQAATFLWELAKYRGDPFTLKTLMKLFPINYFDVLQEWLNTFNEEERWDIISLIMREEMENEEFIVKDTVWSTHVGNWTFYELFDALSPQERHQQLDRLLREGVYFTRDDFKQGNIDSWQEVTQSLIDHQWAKAVNADEIIVTGTMGHERKEMAETLGEKTYRKLQKIWRKGFGHFGDDNFYAMVHKLAIFVYLKEKLPHLWDPRDPEVLDFWQKVMTNISYESPQPQGSQVQDPHKVVIYFGQDIHQAIDEIATRIQARYPDITSAKHAATEGDVDLGPISKNDNAMSTQGTTQSLSSLRSLEDYLKSQEFQDHKEVTKAMVILKTYPQTLLEIGGGSFERADQIARHDRRMGVVSTDQFEEDGYYSFNEQRWKNRLLRTQKNPPENLALLKADVRMITGKLPNHSLDYILVENPDDPAWVYIRENVEIVKRKLKPGGVLIMKPHYGDHIKDLTRLGFTPWREDLTPGIDMNYRVPEYDNNFPPMILTTSMTNNDKAMAVQKTSQALSTWKGLEEYLERGNVQKENEVRKAIDLLSTGRKTIWKIGIKEPRWTQDIVAKRNQNFRMVVSDDFSPERTYSQGESYEKWQKGTLTIQQAQPNELAIVNAKVQEMLPLIPDGSLDIMIVENTDKDILAYIVTNLQLIGMKLKPGGLLFICPFGPNEQLLSPIVFKHWSQESSIPQNIKFPERVSYFLSSQIGVLRKENFNQAMTASLVDPQSILKNPLEPPSFAILPDHRQGLKLPSQGKGLVAVPLKALQEMSKTHPFNIWLKDVPLRIRISEDGKSIVMKNRSIVPLPDLKYSIGEEIILGRSFHDPIPKDITWDRISREHVRLRVEDSKDGPLLLIEDLSKYGTFIAIDDIRYLWEESGQASERRNQAAEPLAKESLENDQTYILEQLQEEGDVKIVKEKIMSSIAARKTVSELTANWNNGRLNLKIPDEETDRYKNLTKAIEVALNFVFKDDPKERAELLSEAEQMKPIYLYLGRDIYDDVSAKKVIIGEFDSQVLGAEARLFFLSQFFSGKISNYIDGDLIKDAVLSVGSKSRGQLNLVQFLTNYFQLVYQFETAKNSVELQSALTPLLTIYRSHKYAKAVHLGRAKVFVNGQWFLDEEHILSELDPNSNNTPFTIVPQEKAPTIEEFQTFVRKQGDNAKKHFYIFHEVLKTSSHKWMVAARDGRIELYYTSEKYTEIYGRDMWVRFEGAIGMVAKKFGVFNRNPLSIKFIHPRVPTLNWMNEPSARKINQLLKTSQLKIVELPFKSEDQIIGKLHVQFGLLFAPDGKAISKDYKGSYVYGKNEKQVDLVRRFFDWGGEASQVIAQYKMKGFENQLQYNITLQTHTPVPNSLSFLPQNDLAMKAEDKELDTWGLFLRDLFPWLTMASIASMAVGYFYDSPHLFFGGLGAGVVYAGDTLRSIVRTPKGEERVSNKILFCVAAAILGAGVSFGRAPARDHINLESKFDRIMQESKSDFEVGRQTNNTLLDQFRKIVQNSFEYLQDERSNYFDSWEIDLLNQAKNHPSDEFKRAFWEVASWQALYLSGPNLREPLLRSIQEVFSTKELEDWIFQNRNDIPVHQMFSLYSALMKDNPTQATEFYLHLMVNSHNRTLTEDTADEIMRVFPNYESWKQWINLHTPQEREQILIVLFTKTIKSNEDFLGLTNSEHRNKLYFKKYIEDMSPEDRQALLEKMLISTGIVHERDVSPRGLWKEFCKILINNHLAIPISEEEIFITVNLKNHIEQVASLLGIPASKVTTIQGLLRETNLGSRSTLLHRFASFMLLKPEIVYLNSDEGLRFGGWVFNVGFDKLLSLYDEDPHKFLSEMKRRIIFWYPDMGTVKRLEREPLKFDEVPKSSVGDKAMINMKGGVDFNSSNLNLQIKRDGKGVPLPLAQQDMAQLIQIEGFIPVILEIKPVRDLPIFSELSREHRTVSS